MYSYDAQGNRISKALFRSNGTVGYTWYVRDAQGNTLATYQSSGTNTISQFNDFPLSVTERHLYGSSRLGIYSQQVDVDNGPLSMQYVQAFKQYRGFKQYELSNHLGNVLATITDKKKGVDGNADGIVNYFDADVTTAQDYYPFGMMMPGRIGYRGESGWVSEPGEDDEGGNSIPDVVAFDSRENNAPPEYKATSSIELNPGFESGAGDAFLAYISEAEEGGGSGSGNNSSLSNGYYRYGFNGKENDNEVKGIGNQQDYGMRIYDPRLGRFLSVDPLVKEYPWLTPYQFAGNTPIMSIDLDGTESLFSVGSGRIGKEVSALRSVVYDPVINMKSALQQKAVQKTADFYEQLAFTFTPNASSLDEKQKQIQFKTGSEQAIGILLYEFASGTGPQKRDFYYGKDKFADDIINGSSTGMVVWGIGYVPGEIAPVNKRPLWKEIESEVYKQIEAGKLDFKDLLQNKTSQYLIAVPFTPDHTSLGESFEKHTSSNLSQLFVGGAVAFITADSENSISVVLVNKTSASSGGYRILNNINDKGNNRRKLSTIEQNIHFRITNLNKDRLTKKEDKN